jgi:hypothetical protein
VSVGQYIVAGAGAVLGTVVPRGAHAHRSKDRTEIARDCLHLVIAFPHRHLHMVDFVQTKQNSTARLFPSQVDGPSAVQKFGDGLVGCQPQSAIR